MDASARFGTGPDPALEERAYRWDAAEYARHSAGQFTWARELIAGLALEGDEAVVDIGCGDGKVTALLAQKVPRGRVLGIDNALSMINLARRSYPGSSYPNLAFQVMDATRLDCPAQFDLAFSNAVLHWVKDHPAVLKGVSRCLRPGGRLLFQMGGQGNAAEIIEVIDRIKANDRWRPYFRDFSFPYAFYSPDVYRPWLAQAGFEVERLVLLSKDMGHKGKTGLAGWIRTTWLPYLERIPEARRDKFVEEIVTSYVKLHPPDDGGSIHVSMVRLEVTARARDHKVK